MAKKQKIGMQKELFPTDNFQRALKTLEGGYDDYSKFFGPKKVKISGVRLRRIALHAIKELTQLRKDILEQSKK